MKSKGIFTATKVDGSPSTLWPSDKHAEEIMRAVKHGQEIMVSVHTPRNPAHHRLAWALAEVLADNLDGLTDSEHAMKMLKRAAGHVDHWVDIKTGELHTELKSIAFESLDQVHFTRLFNRFVDIIITDLIPGMEEKALRDRVAEMVDGDLGRRAKRGGR